MCYLMCAAIEFTMEAVRGGARHGISIFFQTANNFQLCGIFLLVQEG